MSFNQTVQKSDNPAISYIEKKDCLSVSGYREHGKTSLATISIRIGNLSFTKGGDDNFLLGDKHYSVTMPANPPEKVFWYIVVYDVNSRTLILNEEGRPAVSSRTGIKENADGSVTLHFSPTLPKGVDEANWIQTNPEESWFTYLRFYGPTEAYFDETYPLQDIMLVKE